VRKKEYSLPISSHLLEMLIIDAFEFNKGNIPRDFTKKFLMTITYIEKNIMYRQITSIEYTNNVLSDFDVSDKLLIQKSVIIYLEIININLIKF
jgi:hypothetical protein